MEACVESVFPVVSPEAIPYPTAVEIEKIEEASCDAYLETQDQDTGAQQEHEEEIARVCA